MSKRARRIWLLISFFVAGGLAHLLVRAGTDERARLEANFNRIASMTRVERLRLDRNFEEFNELSPADQARYRELHARLEADSQGTGMHVEVMDSYYAWLSTLRGDQREALRKETNPQARRDLVEVIVEEQTAPPPEFGGQRGRWNLFLTSEQLDQVFDAIAAENPILLSEELDGLSGLQRHLKFLELLITRYRPPDEEMWVVPNIFQQLHDQDRLDEALAVIDDQALRQHIENNPDGKEPGNAFGGLVWWSVLIEIGEYRNDHKPTDEELNTVFNSLSEARQDELLALGAEDFQSALKLEFEERQLRDLNPSDDIFNLYRPWQRPRPWEWRQGRFGGGNPRDGGDGGRPFGDGQRGDRDNDGDRRERDDGDHNDDGDDS